MPEISVIVPVYNAKAYLRRCVDSILAQSFTDFELILVDDGSTDKSGEICDEYAAAHSTVKVLHQKNMGVSAARNNGVAVASGEYVTFVDSDDYVHPDYLRTLFDNAVSAKADVSIVSAHFTSSKEPVITDNSVSEYNGRSAIEHFGIVNNYKFRGPCVKLVRKGLLAEYPFPEGITHGEDLSVVFLWLFYSDKVVDSTAQMYYYFDNNSASVTHSGFNIKLLDDLFAYEKLVRFCQENSIDTVYRSFLIDYIIKIIIYLSELRKLNKYRDRQKQLKKKLRAALTEATHAGVVSKIEYQHYIRHLHPAASGIKLKIKRKCRHFKEFFSERSKKPK